MKVVILGCGRAGSILAQLLARDSHDVTIIDYNADAFRRIADSKVHQVVGTGIDVAVLRRAGIEQADVFIAVTNGDNTNIMSTQIATREFNVPKSLARIYDPSRAQAYREIVVNTICTSMLAAGLLRDFVLDKPWGSVLDYIDPPVATQGDAQMDGEA